MRMRKLWGIIFVVALAALGVFWCFLCPTGRETVEAMDYTADEVTGKRAVDQGQPLRHEVKDFSTDQKEWLRRIGLGEAAEGR